MSDRDAFIRTIAEECDAPLPVLVYADYAEENGLDDPELLRWYGFEVMPALAAVPLDHAPATDSARERARRALRPHPQAELLQKLATVAFRSRPEVWNSLQLEVTREAITITRLAAIGLATPDERRAILLKAVAVEKSLNERAPGLERDLREFQTNTDRERAQERVSEHRLLLSEAIFAREIADAAGPSCSVRALWGEPPGTRARMKGWQTAVYLALANVPPLPRGEPVSPPPRPQKGHIGRYQVQPGSAGNIVIESVRYSLRLICDRLTGPDPPPERAFHPIRLEICGPIAGCQRLVVRFGYPVWNFVGGVAQHPSSELTRRIVSEALSAGWRPCTSDLPDLEVDGRRHLLPATESVFG